MRAVFLGILVLFKCRVYALEYNFNGDIKNFVVGKDKVYVVTDSRLHQMRLDLVEEKYKDLANHTHPNKINILLPFEANRSLIICGTYDCGYCEVLDINDITRNIYREALSGVPLANETSVTLLVDFDKNKGENSSGNKYLLVARESERKNSRCIFQGSVTLLNTLHSQEGAIFSITSIEPTDANVKTKADVEWVGGFQTASHSHSYLFLNVKSTKPPSVLLLRMDNSGKKIEMTKSLTGAQLECCDDKPRRKLLSSAVISYDAPVLWAGIFTALEEHANTALAIFDISDPGNQVPTHFSCDPQCTNKEKHKELRPVSVVLKHSSMTSVAAQKKGSGIVLYIGTANGQLKKLVLDKTFRPGCAMVLYRSDDDRMLFPRMHFHPEDDKYIYIALRNQIRRVSVTQCGIYKTLRDCRSSPDPLCGWCLNTSTCSTQHECSDSAWISIPDKPFQKGMISFQVAKHSGNSLIQLTVTLHLGVEGPGRPPLLLCTFRSGSKDLCDVRPTAVFPKCSCTFSSQDLPSEGLPVRATVTIGNENLIESLKLRNCSDISATSTHAACTDCVSAGCHWSNSGQTCTWNDGSAPQEDIQDLCKGLSAGNYRPEIHSLWPSQVSFHGRNNAVMKGTNLEQVVKIRLHGTMDCIAKESPVLERSSDTLKFHIPSGNKGTVSVCVVTADGSCHSDATITYGSQPTCSGLQPRTTWASGGRRIEVLGTNLQYVEKIAMHPSNKEMSIKSSSEGVWFHTPHIKVSQGYGPFSVSLLVGNVTVPCEHKVFYHPDPQFTDFSISQHFTDLIIILLKKKDTLNMSKDDVKVWGLQDKQQMECMIQEIASNLVICKILTAQEDKINSLKINVGEFSTVLTKGKSTKSLFCIQGFL